MRVQSQRFYLQIHLIRKNTLKLCRLQILCFFKLLLLSISIQIKNYTTEKKNHNIKLLNLLYW